MQSRWITAAMVVLALAVCSVVPLGATCSKAATLSNSELATSMPGEVESILIVRSAELNRSGSQFQRWLQAMQTPEEQSDKGYDGKVDQALVLENQITRAGVHTILWAGSHFVAPEGIGAARADIRTVYATTESLDPLDGALQERAARDSTLGTGTEEGIRFFKTRTTKRSGHEGVDVPADVYLAFADSCTAVLTGSLPELVSIIKHLRNPGSAAGRWPVPSWVDERAPLLLLREVKPPLLDGTNQRLGKEQPFRLALTVRDPAVPRFAFGVETPLSKKKALRYFQQALLSDLMGEEDYRLTFERAPQGFEGQLELVADAEGESYPDLVVLWLFGLWMII